MFKMITKIECYDCGSNSNIRKCTDYNEIIIHLCEDCVVDRTEEYFAEEENENEK